MATDETSGDRVSFADNERLDKDDAHLMQELGQELTTRTLGALLGTAGSDAQRYGGVVAGVSTVWDSGTKRLTIGPGLFLDSQAGGSPNAVAFARIVRHDPSTPGQNSGVDLSAQAGSSTTCIIWGKRSTVGGPLQSRKFWNVGDAAERSSSLPTTRRERVVFTAEDATFSNSEVTAYTDPGAGWFPVVGIRAWSGGNPTTLILSAYDAWRGNGSALGDVGVGRISTHGLLGGGFTVGLLRLLRQVRLGISYITAQDGTAPWLLQGAAQTYRGLKELDTDLASTESVVSTIQKVVALGTALYINDIATSGKYKRKVYPTDSTFLGSSTDVLPIQFTPTGTGLFTISLSGIPVGWTVVAAHATEPADGTGTVPGRLKAVAWSATSILVDAYDVDGVPANIGSFTLTVFGRKT